MRISRAALALTAVGCIALSSRAGAEPPRRAPTHAEAVARVGRLHDALKEISAIVARAKRRNATDDTSVALDVSTEPTKYNCPTSGSVSIATSAAAGSGAQGTVTVTATLGSCGTSGSTLDGSVTMTYTTSPSTPATTTVMYTGGSIAVRGVNAGNYQLAKLVVSSAPTDAGSTTNAVIDGSAIIDGHPVTFANEPVVK